MEAPTNSEALLYPNPQQWRDLYRAALLETDNTKLPERVTKAEELIVTRARQLFGAGIHDFEESQALDDALYALRALQSCVRWNTKVA